MQAMKFRVNSPEHSEQIQEKLFEMGYGWNRHSKDFRHQHADFLFADEAGQVTFEGSDTEYFENHNLKECILTPQGTFAKVEDYYKQPETLAVAGMSQDEIEQAIIKKYLPQGSYVLPLFNSEKPPFGLKPKKEHDQQRLLEIIDAMSCYASAGKVIPNEWLAEVIELNNHMEDM